jgi:lipid-binding SYLF domain-containing protein
VSPADSFATAIGVGIGIGIGIELTNLISVQLLADRLATLSALREHGHTTIEQCLLLAVIVCGQRFAHQRARPEPQRTPAPSLV